jgi:hypothetical protein
MKEKPDRKRTSAEAKRSPIKEVPSKKPRSLKIERLEPRVAPGFVGWR